MYSNGLKWTTSRLPTNGTEAPWSTYLGSGHALICSTIWSLFGDSEHFGHARLNPSDPLVVGACHTVMVQTLRSASQLGTSKRSLIESWKSQLWHGSPFTQESRFSKIFRYVLIVDKFMPIRDNEARREFRSRLNPGGQNVPPRWKQLPFLEIPESSFNLFVPVDHENDLQSC